MASNTRQSLAAPRRLQIYRLHAQAMDAAPKRACGKLFPGSRHRINFLSEPARPDEGSHARFWVRTRLGAVVAGGTRQHIRVPRRQGPIEIVPSA